MNIDYDDVLALEQAGAVSVRGDGFGAAIVSTAASMTKYISVMSYGQPGLVSQSDLACYGSKLDLIMWLLRAGWVPTKKPLPHKVRSADFGFSMMFSRPTSYFNTLVLLDELADRGVKLVPHFEKDMFYQCLLRLRGSALTYLLRRGQLDKAWCKKAIKDVDQACLAFNAPPLEPDSASEACELLEDAEPRQQPLLPALVDREEYKRVMVTGDVGSVKVYFDHYSGGNGQRVYASCKGGVCHDNCFQWRQCTDFGSRDEIARYFLLGLLHIPCMQIGANT